MKKTFLMIIQVVIIAFILGTSLATANENVSGILNNQVISIWLISNIFLFLLLRWMIQSIRKIKNEVAILNAKVVELEKQPIKASVSDKYQHALAMIKKGDADQEIADSCGLMYGVVELLRQLHSK